MRSTTSWPGIGLTIVSGSSCDMTSNMTSTAQDPTADAAAYPAFVTFRNLAPADRADFFAMLFPNPQRR